jgi:uroporphyrinogen-III synthase
MKVWVTRAEPGASRTAQRLRALGHEPLVAPVLAVRALPAVIDLSDIGALAFTSANGVRAFAALTRDRGLPAFCVGDATAHAAREAGFTAVASADGDVAALAEVIAQAGQGIAGTVLFAGAAEPAGDLVGALTRQGIKARAAAVYETELTGAGAPDGARAVLIHSPRAAAAIARLPVMDLTAYCISPAAAAPLAGRMPTAAAPEPNDASLLALLGNRGGPR